MVQAREKIKGKKMAENIKKRIYGDMANSLINMNDFVNDAIELSEKDNTVPVSSFLGLVHQIGYLTSFFNQLMALEGETSESNQEAIGFNIKSK